jgi:hypothetical protein
VTFKQATVLKVVVASGTFLPSLFRERAAASGSRLLDHQVAEIHDSGALDPPRKQAAE